MSRTLSLPAEEGQDETFEDVGSTTRPQSLFFNPLLWVILCTAASAYQGLRAEWGGLFVHPYLLVSFLLVFRSLKRIHHFPSRIGRPALLFLGMFAIILIRDRNAGFYLLKMGAIIVTFVLVSLSVRTREDFMAGVFGLGLCVTLLSIKGMLRGVGHYASINPIEGTQKNAFSLYNLPAFAICLEVLQWPGLSVRRRLALIAMLTMTSGAILLSTNRSGWIERSLRGNLGACGNKKSGRAFSWC